MTLKSSLNSWSSHIVRREGEEIRRGNSIGYVTEILRDSEDYRIHSSKEKIGSFLSFFLFLLFLLSHKVPFLEEILLDEKDVALAVDMRKVSSFTAPPSREVFFCMPRESEKGK